MLVQAVSHAQVSQAQTRYAVTGFLKSLPDRALETTYN